MTPAQIITAARDIVKDAGAVKWNASAMLGFVLDGVRELQRDHPEARLSGGRLRAVVETLDKDEEIPLDRAYWAALVAYTCARCFETDAGNERDAAQALYHRRLLASMFAPEAGQ